MTVEFTAVHIYICIYSCTVNTSTKLPIQRVYLNVAHLGFGPGNSSNHVAETTKQPALRLTRQSPRSARGDSGFGLTTCTAKSKELVFSWEFTTKDIMIKQYYIWNEKTISFNLFYINFMML